MEDEKNNMLKGIGQRIQKYRLEKKLTQEQLAEMTGISQKHISRLERGIHAPHIDMIIKLQKHWMFLQIFLLRICLLII